MPLINPVFLPKKVCVLLLLAICVFSTATFCQNIESGKYLERHLNGEVKISGHYKNGLKKGYWFYYTSNGQTERKERWKNGTLINTFIYNEKGRLISITDKSGQIRYMPDCNCR